MENKDIVLKEKNKMVVSEVGKDKKSKEVARVENVDEVQKNDDMMKKVSIEDLNSDKQDFVFQDLKLIINLILFVMHSHSGSWLLLIDLLKSFWVRIIPMKERKNLQLKSLNIKFLF